MGKTAVVFFDLMSVFRPRFRLRTKSIFKEKRRRRRRKTWMNTSEDQIHLLPVKAPALLAFSGQAEGTIGAQQPQRPGLFAPPAVAAAHSDASGRRQHLSDKT